MSQNILVTGGAGFIGSYIVNHHLDKGDQVWVIDNLSTGKKENVTPYKNSTQYRFSEADLREWDQLDEAVEWSDRIYHMAATVGQRLVLSHPINTLTNNIEGCEVICKSMSRLNKNTRLMIASSSSVYYHTEPDDDGMYHENALLSFASDELLEETYPLSKLINEMMVLSYVYEKDIHCTIARIFNTIGVNQRALYGMVVPNFIRQALSNQPITVFGPGSQTRSFCNAHDTSKALDILLSTPESKGLVVNVGSEQECSILDLAKLVKQRTNSDSEIIFVSYQEAYGVDFIDVKRRHPCLQRLKEQTGFTPEWSLEATIDEISTHTNAFRT
jgi:nucleoside-diphosphate-sugar epimerase